MCVCLYVCDVKVVVVSTCPTARANLDNGCKGPIPPLFVDRGRRTSTLGRSRIDSSFEPQDVLPPLQACAQDIIEMMPRRFVGGYGSGDAAARDLSIWLTCARNYVAEPSHRLGQLNRKAIRCRLSYAD